jgi:hypothetical protein
MNILSAFKNQGYARNRRVSKRGQRRHSRCVGGGLSRPVSTRTKKQISAFIALTFVLPRLSTCPMLKHSSPNGRAIAGAAQPKRWNGLSQLSQLRRCKSLLRRRELTASGGWENADVNLEENARRRQTEMNPIEPQECVRQLGWKTTLVVCAAKEG